MVKWGLLGGVASAGLCGSVILSVAVAQGREACPGGNPPTATLVTLDGAVAAKASDGTAIALAIGSVLCPGDAITTGQDGRVEIRFTAKETTVGLSHDSSVRLPAAGDREADIDLDSGILRFISSVRDFFAARTRHANAGIDGTEAVIAVDGPAADSLFVVQEGDVTVTARQGARTSLSLLRGQAGFVSQGTDLVLATAAAVPEKFRTLVANPEGAADWAIHFPPVLPATGAPPAAVQAAALLRAGDPDAAEALLAGRQDAYSLALGSVIAIRRNRKAEGADLAARAVAADPALGVAHLAQSYALQAEGRIGAARDAAARAVAADPADSNARARLAELMLIEGDRAGALAAIEGIPESGHTALSRAVEGLAALAAYDRTAADIAFGQAIALDSEAPLPRMGLGLSKIRAGDVAGGRRELELAAALDPRLASTRTWLGRAYAEEGQDEKAVSQFEEAKARDPDDPTPWLFSAREKFAANRPVEALADLRNADEKGRGRDTVRSEAALGEDRAVRGAAIGRVNQVLGFETRAINTGAAAAEADPANPAAHFLLADALRTRSGRDGVRTSALLQAQVYDPPGKTIIRPQLAESNLALLETEGPARATFFEFAPFFDSDGFAAEVDGWGGTQDSFGNQASFTMLHQGFSLGVGQYHTQTDGYGANNDVNHDIVSVQGRATVTAWLDLFAEYRYRDTRNGDRLLDFDLSDATLGLSEEDRRNLLRIGFHGTLGPGQDLAGIFTYVNQDSAAVLPADDFGFESVETFGDRDAYEGQLQHVGRFGGLTTVSGLSYGRVDADLRLDRVLNFDAFCDFVPDFCGVVTRESEFTDSEIRHFNAYHYSTLRLDDLGVLAGAELTAGVSLDSFEDTFQGGRDTTKVNPKIGARIEIADGFVLRGAYSHALVGDFLLDQRLEPATLAGFTQYVDQAAGSTIRQAAVGADAQLLPWLGLGGEAYWRWIDTPRFDLSGDTVGTDEREFRAYANVTLADRVAATLEVSHERSESPAGLSDLELFKVTELHGGASYFHPSGFFASAGIGYVWHEFQGFGDSGKDDFPIADAMVGYRLPDERGLISVAIQNAFDESFGFQDRPVLSLNNTAAEPRYAREFSAMARLTLKF